LSTSGYWQDLTTNDFDGLDAERTIALLPVAAVEQHGPHLPLATDALINAGLVDGLLKRTGDNARVLVLPAMTIGHSLEHRDFAGTLSVSAETLLASWVEVGASVARAGLSKLVLLNTHGGQTSIVQLAALRLRAEHRMLVARANYFAFGSPPGLFAAEELQYGIHGGEMETSLLLHLRPDLVRREALADFSGLPQQLAQHNHVFGAEKPVGFGWMSQDLHPAGVLGNAARADAMRGKQLLEYLVTKLERLIEEVAAMPMETLKD
jgi:creatinine amidohydrolase